LILPKASKCDNWGKQPHLDNLLLGENIRTLSRSAKGVPMSRRKVHHRLGFWQRCHGLCAGVFVELGTHLQGVELGEEGRQQQ